MKYVPQPHVHTSVFKEGKSWKWQIVVTTDDMKVKDGFWITSDNTNKPSYMNEMAAWVDLQIELKQTIKDLIEIYENKKECNK